MTCELRTATVDDRAAILVLVRDAFSSGGRDGGEEVTIVEDTWSSDEMSGACALVAVDDDEVVGHVLGAPGDLGGRAALAVAPLAVAASHRGGGVGSALMTELLTRAEASGWPLVVLLGAPAYYSRFGFEPAGPFGIVYPPVGADSPHFMVRWFVRDDRAPRGEFRYCWEPRGG